MAGPVDPSAPRLEPSELRRLADAQSKYTMALLLAVLSSIVSFGVSIATSWPMTIALTVLCLGWLPFYYVIYLVRRCPRCRKSLGNRPDHKFCPHCGVAFEASGA